MTDNELLSKLAEIEGVERRELADGPRPKRIVYGRGWDPLTNWSDCGPLVDKYRPHITQSGTAWAVLIVKDYHIDTDLKRALCVAIVSMEEEV